MGPRHQSRTAINDLAQLVGDSEAANAAVNMCKEKISKGNNEEAASAVGWLKIMQKRAGGNLAPNGQKGRDKKGKGG